MKFNYRAELNYFVETTICREARRRCANKYKNSRGPHTRAAARSLSLSPFDASLPNKAARALIILFTAYA
jgi:hypothetical protein